MTDELDSKNSKIKINLGSGNNYINVSSGNVDIETGKGDQTIIATALDKIKIKTDGIGNGKIVTNAPSVDIDTGDDDNRPTDAGQ